MPIKAFNVIIHYFNEFGNILGKHTLCILGFLGPKTDDCEVHPLHTG